MRTRELERERGSAVLVQGRCVCFYFKHRPQAVPQRAAGGCASAAAVRLACVTGRGRREKAKGKGKGGVSLACHLSRNFSPSLTSATRACSALTTSMMTPPLSICGMPFFTTVVPAAGWFRSEGERCDVAQSVGFSTELSLSFAVAAAEAEAE